MSSELAGTCMRTESGAQPLRGARLTSAFAPDAPAVASVPVEREWAAACAHLTGGQRVLICTHHAPDGDAAGALLGLGITLTALGKSCTMACADPLPRALAFLPSFEHASSRLPVAAATAAEPLPWDLIVVVDAANLRRLGPVYEAHRRVFATLPVLNIDHHVSNDCFGTINLVDTSAAATCEVLYLLLRRFGAPITDEVATCLLAGLVTDTLSFQTESTTSRTLRIAGELVDAGGPIANIALRVFRSRSRGAARLWARVLSALQFTLEGRLACAALSRATLIACGHDADHGGIASFLADIEGVEVAALLREGDDGQVFVSFRSHTRDVGALAQRMGGGGHRRAAGCTLPGTLEDASAAICREVAALLGCDESIPIRLAEHP